MFLEPNKEDGRNDEDAENGCGQNGDGEGQIVPGLLDALKLYIVVVQIIFLHRWRRNMLMV